MGNCYNHPTHHDENMEVESPPTRKFKPLKVLDEDRNMPPISKKIINRLQELEPFFKLKPSLSQRIYRVERGAFYEGSLKKIHDQRVFEGPGRLILQDGTLIESEFQDGKPYHLTRIYKPNGDYFEGFLTNQSDKSFGKVIEGPITYQGGVWNGKPEGKGKQTSSKYEFQGSYKNGMKVKGKLVWNFQDPKNIYSYEGEFENNMFSGEGTLIDKEGTYKGMFQKGKKHGRGELTLPNSKKIIGKFQDGVYVPETNSTEDDPRGVDLPSNHLNKSTWK